MTLALKVTEIFVTRGQWRFVAVMVEGVSDLALQSAELSKLYGGTCLQDIMKYCVSTVSLFVQEYSMGPHFADCLIASLVDPGAHDC